MKLPAWTILFVFPVCASAAIKVRSHELWRMLNNDRVPWSVEWGIHPRAFQPVKPEPNPEFWTTDWDHQARTLVEQAYVVFTLDQRPPQPALEAERAELIRVLTRLNILARRPCRADPDACRAALDVVIRGNFTRAMEQVRRQTPEFDEARASAALVAVVRAVTDDANLRNVTSAIRTEWRKTSRDALNWRRAQLLGTVLAEIAVSAPFGVTQTAAVQVPAALLLLGVVVDYASSVLPLTTRFDWDTNEVGRAVAACESQLRGSPPAKDVDPAA